MTIKTTQNLNPQATRNKEHVPASLLRDSEFLQDALHPEIKPYSAESLQNPNNILTEPK